MRARQAGFTLLEMMVVVAILAILSTLAIVFIHPHTKPVDVSYRVAELVREASREAVDYGPVSDAIATAAGGGKARTCVQGSGGAGSSPTFTLNLQVGDLDGGPGTSSWSTIEVYETPSSVQGESYSPEIGNHATVTLATDWDSFKLCCYADGSCDPASLFFEANYSGPSYEKDARLSVLPLGAATLIKSDWTSP